MFTKILVPLDGSARAEAILPYVEDLAARKDATVIFMEVVEPIPIIMDAHESVIVMQMDELRVREQEARAYMTARAGEFRARGLQARIRMQHGPVAEAICNQAEADGVDLIAMASHGRGGLGQMVYGSVASAVLHKTDKPMLLIRSRDA